jgi:hypothetical protein
LRRAATRFLACTALAPHSGGVRTHIDVTPAHLYPPPPLPPPQKALYGRICEYLELGERVEVLNARFSVLQEMLDMLRDHLNNQHSSRLEVIVIVLIFVEVVVGLVELVGLFGWFNKK